MRLENIKLFLATYQLGSFASVAKSLNIAPSSVSRAIAQLEADLNTRLFERNTRHLTPTQEGRYYYNQVLPVIDELQYVHAHFEQQADLPSGTLRVSASVSFAQIILQPFLQAFCQQYPELRFELKLDDNIVDLFEAQIDLAIRHGQLDDSSLIAKKLCSTQYQLVASPDYLHSKGLPASLEDLKDHDLLTFSYPAFNKTWQFKKENRLESMDIQPKLSISNAVMLRDCAIRGMGIALLADWTVKQAVTDNALIHVLEDWTVGGEVNRAIWAVYPSRRFVPKRTRLFIDELSQFITSQTP